MRRALCGLLGLSVLYACEDEEAQRQALELALSTAEAQVAEAQLAINRYDGTAEIEEIVAEGEADQRAVIAGDLPPAEAAHRAAAREIRLAALLASQRNLDVTQDTVWLRMATTVEAARTAQRQAREALDLFLREQQD